MPADLIVTRTASPCFRQVRPSPVSTTHGSRRGSHEPRAFCAEGTGKGGGVYEAPQSSVQTSDRHPDGIHHRWQSESCFMKNPRQRPIFRPRRRLNTRVAPPKNQLNRGAVQYFSCSSTPETAFPYVYLPSQPLELDIHRYGYLSMPWNHPWFTLAFRQTSVDNVKYRKSAILGSI